MGDDHQRAEGKAAEAAVLLGPPPNTTMETDSPHWYVSYNTGNYFDYGCVTTALVLGQCEYCLVLKGDHRQGFKRILDLPFEEQKGRTRLALCLAYVRENRGQLHEYSDPII